MSAVLEAIARQAGQAGDRTALTDGESVLSYRQLEDAIARAADELQARCPGTKPVATIMDNSAAWVVLDLALVRLARVHIPLPPFFTDAQRQHALASAGAGHLIMPAPAAPEALQICGTSLRVLALDLPAVPLPPATAKITYTSGSTGTPKGVCLSQAMMEETAQTICSVVGAEHAKLHLAVLPLAVLLENIAGLYAVLLAHGAYACPPLGSIGFEKPFAPDFLSLADGLRRSEATSAILVPELLRGLVGALAATRQTLPSLRFLAVGGASVSPRLLAQAAMLGLPVHEGYGLSEAGSVVTLNRPGKARPGTAGPFLPHVAAQISSDGELIITHPVFLGYVGGGAAPTHLATGDVVELDGGGHVAIRGRKSNTIITGFGRNISPEWVERELLAQPAIRQAMVYGDGSASLSALIVPMATDVTTNEVASAVAAANGQLPEYAAVQNWRLVGPFTPLNGQLTANGRLRRQAIHAAHGITHAAHGITHAPSSNNQEISA